MRFFSVIGVLFYTLVLSFIGGLIIWFSLHWLNLEDIFSLLKLVYTDPNLRLITGFSGLLLILISFSFFQLILGKIQKERTIAFNNPSGQVSVSLSAVEDFVKRLTSQMPEIKESRPHVIVDKKGIQIMLNVILRETINIPEITLRLQELIKAKVQDILGVEETISVTIHVVKIVTAEDKKEKKKISDIQKEETAIPFQGYRPT